MLNFQILISDISDTNIILTLSIVIFSILYFKNKKIDALIVLFSSTLALSITFILKNLLKVPRPENMLVLQDGYRFPSGHATMAAVVATLVIYFAVKYLHSNTEINKAHKYVLYVFAVLWLLLVSYSRLYLGVHYFIDVVVGGLIGVISTLFVIKVAKHLRWFR